MSKEYGQWLVITKSKVDWGGGGISYKVVREVLSEEETLSKGLEGVREKVRQITKSSVFQTVGNSERQASEQQCARRNIREGRQDCD